MRSTFGFWNLKHCLVDLLVKLFTGILNILVKVFDFIFQCISFINEWLFLVDDQEEQSGSSLQAMTFAPAKLEVAIDTSS